MAEASSHAAAILVFNTPGFEWHESGGAASPYHIWTAGDYWAQNFQQTGLPSANQMSLSLLFNSLTGPQTNLLDLNVYLNGIDIGSFSVPSGITGLQNFTFSFSDVLGPDYRIQIQAANTIPSGDGSVSIAPDGSSFATLTSVPEPTVLTLGSLSALAIIWQHRLRSRREVPTTRA
jgi:hypothetical protein